MRNIEAVVFDLGNTLIVEVVDYDFTLDQVSLELLPGAAEVLSSLSKIYRVGVLSNTESSSSGAVRRALATLGVGGFVDVVVTSVDEGIRKPDRRIFDRTLELLNATAEQSVMIGNDLRCDIEGAKQIGMTTIFYSPDCKISQPPKVADYSVGWLVEIIGILS